MLFRSVLVANRGEVAVRVIRTLDRLGIASVAVHTAEDDGAPHVAAAGSAVRVASYLDGGAIVDAARRVGAEAVHPGYGFLAERASFARACADAGLVFVGPGPEAIETMGDKIAARAAVTARGVPVVPGVSGHGLHDDALLAGAERIGFPVLVKPAAGGGGKGMRVVERAEDLPAALASARREAAAAFGDEALFLERYVASPRHIEVQVLADAHGNVVHLGERECSLQRRHQKVVEEAPSPLLTDAQRAGLGEAAVATARAVDYVGVGTVEFIVSADAPDEPYFIEMNTRLQVEHPVTEMVTGIDLVAEQLHVAAGRQLRLRQDQVQIRGHAVEARVYAEDPDEAFLPTGGHLLDLTLPTATDLPPTPTTPTPRPTPTPLAADSTVADGDHDSSERAGPDPRGWPARVRVDHALRPGVVASSSYDPLLAKVVAHAPTRGEALAALDRALAGTHLLGVVTNVAFLRRLLALDEVRAGALDTGLVERRLGALQRPPVTAAEYAIGALARWHHVRRRSPRTLWHTPWRMGGPAPVVVRFTGPDGAPVTVRLTGSPTDAEAVVERLPGRTPATGRSAAGTRQGLTPGPAGRGHTAQHAGRHAGTGPTGVSSEQDQLRRGSESALPQLELGARGEKCALTADAELSAVWVDGVRMPLRWHCTDTAVWIGTPDGDRELTLHVPARGSGRTDQSPALESPMPGTVVAVLAADGAHVEDGEPVLAVEAMKMEHVLRAPTAGTVRLLVTEGHTVRRGQELAQVVPAGPAPQETAGLPTPPTARPTRPAAPDRPDTPVDGTAQAGSPGPREETHA